MTETTITKIAAADVPPNRRRGGDIRVLLSPKTVGSTSGFFGLLTLRPGEYVAEHYHPYSEEFLYVTDGSLSVAIDGGPLLTLECGEGVMIPPSVRHRVTNASAAMVHAVFHLSPLAPRPELGHVDTEAPPEPAAPGLDVGSGR